jgi:hypothetical protein
MRITEFELRQLDTTRNLKIGYKKNANRDVHHFLYPLSMLTIQVRNLRADIGEGAGVCARIAQKLVGEFKE